MLYGTEIIARLLDTMWILYMFTTLVTWTKPYILFSNGYLVIFYGGFYVPLKEIKDKNSNYPVNSP